MRLFLISAVLLTGCASVRTAKPRAYRYECLFYIYDLRGNHQSRMRIEATHTRGLPEKRIRWNDPRISFSKNPEGKFGKAMKQSYMEGFTYPESNIGEMLKGGFYKDFPSTPFGFLMMVTVVDVHMFDIFVAEFDRMKVNEPHRFETNDSDIDLFSEKGKQKLRHMELTWIGNSTRNGRACAVIRYQSRVDPVSVDVPGASFHGSTIFWGDIWYSLREREVEFATLHEHSLTAPPDPKSPVDRVQNIYRSVTFGRAP